jgi:hypothetical protein
LGSEVSLSVHSGLSELLLFSLGGNCIAFQLQLCLVSSSYSKVGQFSSDYFSLSHRSLPGSTTCLPLGGWLVTLHCSQPLCFSLPLLSATSYFGRLTSYPVPAVSLYASSNLCWVFVSPLEGWIFVPPPLSAFIAL